MKGALGKHFYFILLYIPEELTCMNMTDVISDGLVINLFLFDY